MTNELKPCPFCGSEAEIVDVCNDCFISGKVGIGCSKCPVIIAEYGEYKVFDNEAEAIEAWNKRAAYEAEGYFFLPKPKEQLFYSTPLGIEETENGYRAQYGFQILEQAARRWADEIDDEILRRVIECWDTRACDECERGAIPATEENMAAHGWVRERTCQQVDVTGKYKPYVTHMTACSLCGETLAVEEYPAPNYCPNCGAKVVD